MDNEGVKVFDRISTQENFWPSFADMMLSVVLVFLIVMFLLFNIIGQEAFNIEYAQSKQSEFVKDLAGRFDSRPDSINQSLFIIMVKTLQGEDKISIYQEIDRLTLQFSGQILFKSLDHNISSSGREVLKTVGKVIRDHEREFTAIQIRGFADTNPIVHGEYLSNLHLGSYRANEVFFFLKDSLGINPVLHEMSATSYGEFYPVQRMKIKGPYSDSLLQIHNADSTMKALNRRIEIQLFFTTQDANSTAQ